MMFEFPLWIALVVALSVGALSVVTAALFIVIIWLDGRGGGL